MAAILVVRRLFKKMFFKRVITQTQNIIKTNITKNIVQCVDVEHNTTLGYRGHIGDSFVRVVWVIERVEECCGRLISNCAIWICCGDCHMT